ncbi:MAG: helix-turn-helix transcriptional regulator [Lachnospiraceae bacterium]|nr:helix-turn-helix transcriptional regulator [Lachnospiraceae bacterium]
MKVKGLKKYHAVESEVYCEIKSIDAPFDYSGDMHNHDCHEILILEKGNINLYTEYFGREMHDGDIAFIPHYVFHTADIYSSDYDRIIINVTDSVLQRFSTPKMNLSSCFLPFNDTYLHTIHLEPDEMDEVVGYAKEMFKNINSSSAGADILRDCYLKLIMVKFTSKYTADPVLSYPNTMPPLVINTFDYIDKHITEEITLKELENAIHHNGTYISRCVKKISGLTIQQYIIAKRIALACKLLKEGCSASEACFRSGFNNYSNFSRTFTKQAGKSPKQLQMEWRKNLTE